MERDRLTVGLASDTQEILARVMDLGWFQDAQDVARLAFAVAIRAKVPAGNSSDTDTRWAAGNFDLSGELRAVIAALFPACQTPVRLMEHFVNEGLRLIGLKLANPGLTPDQFLE
jgi:hypothetical protein